jgi:hypothetical protein
MIDGTVRIWTSSGERSVPLAAYLDASAEETAHRDAYTWIKHLRHARVEGSTFRERFTVRGDSLWWFTEIYLHKQRAIVDVHRALAAAEALVEREQPARLQLTTTSAVVRHVLPLVAAARGVEVAETAPLTDWTARLRRLRWRARTLTMAAWASRLRASGAPPAPPPRVAAFIHRAFWRSGGEDGSAESYIGPVLKAIGDRVGGPGLAFVGVGPTVNFRARRWWTPLESGLHGAVVPVERYAPWSALHDAQRVWRDRKGNLDALSHSDELRHAAVIKGVDCWPIVREQLAGVVFLQWPWSVRAMDEAGAALDALKPSSVLTYAEAGGWGRALILEARRRRIPSVALQHGFIYREWLNYLHEPDEMEPLGAGDTGFPAPTMTLVFDEYAAHHLRERGRLPPGSLKVTGSPRLDALIASLSSLSADDVAEVKREAGAGEQEAMVLVTTKEKEAHHFLPALVAAAGSLPGVRLVIKPHPAETPAAYDAVGGHAAVTVLAPSAPLAPLIAACRAVVTVNSTVALDAGIAGLPALVIGLPNNLSPFVEAGALAGAATTAEIAPQLERVLYDEGFRQQLKAARRDVLGAHAMQSDGKAAERSAEAVIELAAGPSGLPARKID